MSSLTKDQTRRILRVVVYGTHLPTVAGGVVCQNPSAPRAFGHECPSNEKCPSKTRQMSVANRSKTQMSPSKHVQRFAQLGPPSVKAQTPPDPSNPTVPPGPLPALTRNPTP